MIDKFIDEKHYALFDHLQAFLRDHNRETCNRGYQWFVTTSNYLEDDTNYTRFNFFHSHGGVLDGLELCLGSETTPEIRELLERWKLEYLNSK